MEPRLVLQAVELPAGPPCLPADRRPAGAPAPGQAETLRAAAMEPRAAARFLAGRAALRQFAGDILDIPAGGLTAAYSCPHCGSGPGVSHGRPGYTHEGQRLPLLLSMARAGDWVLLAGLTSPRAGERLGIDAEDPARLGFAGFDAVALADEEADALAGLAGAALLRGRARLWTRKEAWLKMTGEGLRKDPRQVHVLDQPELTDLPPAATGLPASLVAAVALG